MAFHRWEYHNGRPNLLAKIQNRGWALLHALGLYPGRFVTLEVAGRVSGKTVRFPLAMVTLEGVRYLVSMLGVQANWVRNVQAAGGRAELVHGKRERVRLVEVDAGLRAQILKAYLQIAPGARPHIPVDKDAPLEDFEKVAADFPVFRLERAE